MRNSFNTAGFSEVVHEIRADPREAQYTYSVAASSSPSRGISARTRPAILGTVKSARRFERQVMHPSDPQATARGDDEATPLELALTGIASCTLKTMVGGGSARGIVFETVSMDIEYKQASSSDLAEVSGPDGVMEYRLDIETNAADEVIHDLITQVKERSPNHRTITDDVVVRVVCPEFDYAVNAHDLGPATTPPCSAVRNLRWISGTQFESRPVSGESGNALRVDQPKQLSGVDWGPNPQEYLLMALAADLAGALADAMCARLQVRVAWEVSASGRVDIRGLLRADPAAPVPLQDITCILQTDSSDLLSGSAITTIIEDAVTRSSVVHMLSSPHDIDVSSARVIKPTVGRTGPRGAPRDAARG